MNYKKTFAPETVEMMACDSKIGVLATTDEQGYPHLTFLSSIEALDNAHLTFGKFSAGLSKQFLQERPDAGFLVLDADKRFVSGFARYTHRANTGADFERYNAKPLFRYNSYMGFSEVYYLDLLGVTKLAKLPMAQIVLSAILSRLRAPFCADSRHLAMPRVATELFRELGSLKFLCYADAKGRLIVLPIVQATAAGSDRIVFSFLPYGKRLKAIPNHCKAAILCVNLSMESVLVKGTVAKGQLHVERVYNSMPPKMEYVYPRSERIAPVTEFDANPQRVR